MTFWIPEEYEEKLYFYPMDEAQTAKIDDRLYLNIIRKSGNHIDEDAVKKAKSGMLTILLGLNPELIEEEGENELEGRVNACTALFLSWYAKTYHLQIHENINKTVHCKSSFA